MTEATTKLLTAIDELTTAFMAMAADPAHPMSAVKGFGVYGDVSDVRLPALDIWPGALTREGQRAHADIFFKITAPVHGSYAGALRQVYVIERAVWRVLETKLPAAAASALAGGKFEYRGLVEPPKPIERKSGEKVEMLLTASAAATWHFLEHHD